MQNSIEEARYAAPQMLLGVGALVNTELEGSDKYGAEPHVSPVWASVKRGIDFVGASIILVLLTPVLGFIYMMIKRAGGGAIFSQQRIGRNARQFTCYKFRTMVPNAEAVLQSVLESDPALREEWERDEKLRNDPRVTPIGRFLRRTSLDELPQLFNVLKGDMSLVGPRPVFEWDMERYGRGARWYLAVRPGMTGLWQVSGRNDVSYRRRVALDIYYVRAQSLLLDLQILFRTVQVIVHSTGY